MPVEQQADADAGRSSSPYCPAMVEHGARNIAARRRSRFDRPGTIIDLEIATGLDPLFAGDPRYGRHRVSDSDHAARRIHIVHVRLDSLNRAPLRLQAGGRRNAGLCRPNSSVDVFDVVVAVNALKAAPHTARGRHQDTGCA